MPGGEIMSKKADFDQAAAHKYYSANCFNQAWDLIDKEQRTPEEEEQMIRLTHASFYHWTQRPDYSSTSASIGYWQASRIYAILGQADNASRYGQLCLEVSQDQGVEPFFLGYAYEALARAAAAAGNHQDMDLYLEKARQAAAEVKKAEDRKMLLDDLQSIQIN
jgi:hypothetical protein